jgi:ATP phosphoribosyltransferase
MIKVALPNKGILSEPTMSLLTTCGYKVGKAAGALTSFDAENNIEFYFLRPGDIPVYVSNGILDAGITGKDFVAEKGLEPELLLDLNYGGSRLCAAVPRETEIADLQGLRGLRVATSFPAIVERFFGPGELELVELEGAVEIAVQLGIAEAVVDVVDTGTTLKQAGLRVIDPPLFQSNAALYAHPGRCDQDEVQVLKSRIEGRLVAYEYMMVEYDVPEAILPAASKITPGIESPTVAPLQAQGWYSVKAMIRKREANRIMDELSRIGCKGILLTSIESARI